MTESELYRQKFLELPLPKNCPVQDAIRKGWSDSWVLIMPATCSRAVKIGGCEKCLAGEQTK